MWKLNMNSGKNAENIEPLELYYSFHPNLSFLLSFLFVSKGASLSIFSNLSIPIFNMTSLRRQNLKDYAHFNLKSQDWKVSRPFVSQTLCLVRLTFLNLRRKK